MALLGYLCLNLPIPPAPFPREGGERSFGVFHGTKVPSNTPNPLSTTLERHVRNRSSRHSSCVAKVIVKRNRKFCGHLRAGRGRNEGVWSDDHVCVPFYKLLRKSRRHKNLAAVFLFRRHLCIFFHIYFIIEYAAGLCPDFVRFNLIPFVQASLTLDLSL
jgi:hypothetical protein